ncbi:hypothetical protein [Undibacterium sp. TC9W]|uniref:hypothetical protein n=1 Tax=Undibacterium sp. TC9W TaxID=3413053 RepID=UPI003BF200A4
MNSSFSYSAILLATDGSLMTLLSLKGDQTVLAVLPGKGMALRWTNVPCTR